jgi:heterodisulfide reductase subunit A
MKKRAGVFVCQCGTNIEATIDTEKVAEYARTLPGVAYATTYKYMCSDPGQELIRNAIEEHQLEQIVVASCSPRMHENTFRKAVVSGGLNGYMFEMVNIREQISWVHHDLQSATKKAQDLVRMGVSKVLKNKPLQVSTIPITKRALVIGGGIAGMQSALDIAEAGHQVVLVEREASIGGKMTQLDKTFPTMDCAA